MSTKQKAIVLSLNVCINFGNLWKMFAHVDFSRKHAVWGTVTDRYGFWRRSGFSSYVFPNEKRYFQLIFRI